MDRETHYHLYVLPVYELSEDEDMEIMTDSDNDRSTEEQTTMVQVSDTGSALPAGNAEEVEFMSSSSSDENDGDYDVGYNNIKVLQSPKNRKTSESVGK